MLIDQATGQRQLIWAELDANATRAASTDLLIHPGKLLAEGHTFIVALRDLRTSSGKLIKAPTWFARLRAGGRLPAAERSQQGRYATIFRVLKKAGIAVNSSLYEAWNFTVESRRSLTERMLAIRNNAFAQLGDTNLADSVDTGHAPSFSVVDTKPLLSSTGAILTQSAQRAAAGVVQRRGHALTQLAEIRGREPLQIVQLIRLTAEQPGQLEHLGVRVEQIGGAAHPMSCGSGAWLIRRSSGPDRAAAAECAPALARPRPPAPWSGAAGPCGWPSRGRSAHRR